MLCGVKAVRLYRVFPSAALPRWGSGRTCRSKVTAVLLACFLRVNEAALKTVFGEKLSGGGEHIMIGEQRDLCFGGNSSGLISVSY